MERENVHTPIAGLVREVRVRIHFSETVVSHFDISGETLARVLDRIEPGLSTTLTDTDIMADPALARRIMDAIVGISYRDMDGHQVLVTGMEVV